MKEEELNELLDLGRKLEKLCAMSDDLATVKVEVQELHARFSKIEILTPEEIAFIRTGLEAKKIEREFWLDQKKKLASAGIIGACGILLTALWFYVQHKLSGG